MKSWLLYRLQYSAALIVAAVFSIKTPKVALKQGWRAISLWFGFIPKGEKLVSDEVFKARMETCRKCPVFYHKLQTCGTPLRKGEDAKLGCFCFQPAAARLRSKKCFLNESGLAWGWKQDLEFEAEDS